MRIFKLLKNQIQLSTNFCILSIHKLFLGKSHTKVRLNRFSRFDFYWIQTDRQTGKQSIYVDDLASQFVWLFGCFLFFLSKHVKMAEPVWPIFLWWHLTWHQEKIALKFWFFKIHEKKNNKSAKIFLLFLLIWNEKIPKKNNI